MGPALAFSLFHFPLFSVVLLRIYWKILRERGTLNFWGTFSSKQIIEHA